MDHIAYSFSPITGEYTGPVPAQESPLEPGKILRPRNALFVAPPLTDQKECAVFAMEASEDRDSLVGVGGTWSVVADWRSTLLYNTADGSSARIERYGIFPDPVLMTEKPRPTSQHIWDGTDWVLSTERVAEVVKADRDRRLQDVRLKMAPLQDAVDLGEETVDEATSLIAYKQYAVALSRIEQQANFPFDISWPELPV